MKVIVTFEANVPESATEAQIAEWVEFNLGYRGGMLSSNPLSHHELEAESVNNISIV